MVCNPCIPVSRFLETVVLVLAAAFPLSVAWGQDNPASNDPRDTDPPRRADKKVGERLIRKATGDTDDDLMAEILMMMGESSHKLEIDFNPGDNTQALQARIVEQLDEVIKVAASRRRPRLRSMPADSSDKRRKPSGKPDASEKPTDSGQSGEDSTAGTTTEGRTPTTDTDRMRGDLRELRRTWGHLPMREREEVIQGIGETYLQRYRDWIERYYRALQESGE